MEIKANELRIGNLLRDKVSKTELKVIELNENDIITYVIDRSKFPLKAGWGIEPIPLTEEILLKCGFEKYKKLNFAYILDLEYEKIIVELYESGNNDFYFNGNMLLDDLKYLHQLQNLIFALTNQELEINL